MKNILIMLLWTLLMVGCCDGAYVAVEHPVVYTYPVYYSSPRVVYHRPPPLHRRPNVPPPRRSHNHGRR